MSDDTDEAYDLHIEVFDLNTEVEMLRAALARSEEERGRMRAALERIASSDYRTATHTMIVRFATAALSTPDSSEAKA